MKTERDADYAGGLDRRDQPLGSCVRNAAELCVRIRNTPSKSERMNARILDTLSVIKIFSAAIPIVVGIALLGYLAMRRHECRRAVTVAMWAIALTMLTQIVASVGPLVAARYLAFDKLPIVFACLHLGLTVVHALLICMLIAAIFVGRQSIADSNYREIDAGSTALSNMPNSNPYASPRQ